MLFLDNYLDPSHSNEVNQMLRTIDEKKTKTMEDFNSAFTLLGYTIYPFFS